MIDLNTLIDKRMQNEKCIHFETFMEKISIENDNQHFDLKSDIYLLVSENIDIPHTARLEIISPDNYFVTNKLQFNKLSCFKYQFFSDSLSVITSNVKEFIPFELEFIRITPYFKK